MPWVGIEDSGLEFTFTPGAMGVAMVGSVVSCADVLDPSFSINLITEPVAVPQFRVTVQSYSAGNPAGNVEGATFILSSENPSVTVTNQAAPANPQTAFTPAQFSGDCRALAYNAGFGIEWAAIESYSYLIEVETAAPAVVSYNCECEDDYPARRTLAELRTELHERLGYADQAPSAGMVKLLNSFLQGAQRALYRRYSVLRTERIFRWPLVEGVRFYDLDGNDDICTKRLDPRKVRWVGIERDGVWTPLVCGIPPEVYSFGERTGWPTRYEIRQCIEIWPAPDPTPAFLRVKGDFELQPFTDDAHTTTIDDELVFLLALANAKAHYGKPDAANYIGQLETMMSNLVAGSHHTRRYIPGQRVYVNEPEPVWTDGTWPPPP